MEKSDISAVPTVKFLRPDAHAIDDLTVTTFVSPDEFVPRMEKAIRGEGCTGPRATIPVAQDPPETDTNL